MKEMNLKPGQMALANLHYKNHFCLNRIEASSKSKKVIKKTITAKIE